MITIKYKKQKVKQKMKPKRTKYIISMSLYGAGKKYLRGALWNSKNYQIYFPGWTLRIYCSEDCPIQKELIDNGCQVIPQQIIKELGSDYPMLWRFKSLNDTLAKYIIIRDIDSKLNEKDAAATNEWIKSNYDFHIMRDKRAHFAFPILGGLWGIKGGLINNIDEIIEDWRGGRQIQYHHENRTVWDEHFLKDKIWPLIKNNYLEHSSKATPFPIQKSKITCHLCNGRDFSRRG